MLIDFHTHAFEDTLAAKAIPFLEEEGHIQAATDGRISSLMASMDRAGIDQSVVCPIATKPTHFDGIRRWARQVRTQEPRLDMLLSVHPDDPDALAHIDQTAADGFIGLKFHPYYQQFVLDDERLFPLYERIAVRGLLAVFHSGFDIAYPPERICDPIRIRHVIDTFPTLKFVATHLGGWRDCENSRTHLIGRPVYIETSYSLHDMPAAEARAMILDHAPGYILFGTDSPWADQAEELARWRNLDLPDDVLAAALGGNAAHLLQRVKD
ncbi:MAG: amidohydrolase family protein [Kiritimatiellae bacterium]|nr:amidohydrolase family protein [Kiritimatiellia bacterium]